MLFRPYPGIRRIPVGWTKTRRLVAGVITLLPVLWAHAASPPRLDVQPSPRPTNWARLGTSVSVTNADVPFTLFLPHAWTNAPGSVLTLHFHSDPSFAIPEHLRRGASHPITVFMLGSGSAAYARRFTNEAARANVLKTIERSAALIAGSDGIAFDRLEITSFSAGYGAVRELLKSKSWYDRIQAIILLDSFYGGLAPNKGTNRIVLREHVEAWVPFAQAALRKEKRFVTTTSQIHTPNYAATYEVAAALIERLGLKADVVSTNNDAGPITLLRRADAGQLHIWSYSGTNGPAHTAHIQHMADFWGALGK